MTNNDRFATAARVAVMRALMRVVGTLACIVAVLPSAWGHPGNLPWDLGYRTGGAAGQEPGVIRDGPVAEAQDEVGWGRLSFLSGAELAGREVGADVARLAVARLVVAEAPNPAAGALGRTNPLLDKGFWEDASADDVRRAIAAGWDVHAYSEDGWGSIHLAAFRGEPGAVQVLLDEGVSVAATTRGERQRTPLHYAGANSATVVGVLIDAGGDINAKDAWGHTPLHVMAAYATVEGIRILLEAGADLEVTDNAGYTPLHLASAHEPVGNVRALLAGGARVEARNADGLTPLHVAAGRGWVDNVHALLEAGADRHNRDDQGRIPLQHATREASWADSESLRRIAESLIDVEHWYEQLRLSVPAGTPVPGLAGGTIVFAGAREGSGLVVVVRDADGALYGYAHLLAVFVRAGQRVSSGQSLGVVGSSGRAGEPVLRLLTPDSGTRTERLHLAARYGSASDVRALLEAGDSVTASDKVGRTALHHAAGRGPVAVENLRVLLGAGADPGARDWRGRTPLHEASALGSEVSVRALLEAGADVNAMDDEGWAPLHHAASGGMPANAEALLAAGADPRMRDSRGRRPFELIDGADLPDPAAALRTLLAPAVPDRTAFRGLEIGFGNAEVEAELRRRSMRAGYRYDHSISGIGPSIQIMRPEDDSPSARLLLRFRNDGQSPSSSDYHASIGTVSDFDALPAFEVVSMRLSPAYFEAAGVEIRYFAERLLSGHDFVGQQLFPCGRKGVDPDFRTAGERAQDEAWRALGSLISPGFGGSSHFEPVACWVGLLETGEQVRISGQRYEWMVDVRMASPDVAARFRDPDPKFD